MELKFLKEEKDSVIVQFENKDATFASLLKDELWQTKGVDAAAIDKRHPLVGHPELMVQGKDAKKLIKTAAVSLKKKLEDFEKALPKDF
ncbi:hypothetical protein JXB27_01520 [Candidatus Woesearchaeota archaeon]|nr:hypothetical protein [Candidatus Woesearchaeota archaeon]